MIESGEKREEYRVIKPYWCRRLASCGRQLCWIRGDDGECWFNSGLTDLNRLGYTHVRFRYGYTKRTMLYVIDEITIGRGNPNWGAPTDRDVFIIKFYKEKSTRAESKNLKNNKAMKVRVRIDGYVDVDDAATEEQVREAVMFQLGWGGMAVDNPVGEPDWDDIDVDVEL